VQAFADEKPRELNEGLSFGNEATVAQRAERAITAQDTVFRLFQLFMTSGGCSTASRDDYVGYRQ
jgi:hypothetical protein